MSTTTIRVNINKHEQIPRPTMGCCGCLPIAEDNARFLLLAIFLILYMIIGATVFHYLESELEIRQARAFWEQYTEFCTHYIKIHNQKCINDSTGLFASPASETESETLLVQMDDDEKQLVDMNYRNDTVLERLHNLLYAYGNATATGIIHKRRRWDFAGSFHFVGTIVSTIGYGSTSPQTTAGKAVVIIYGFLGCSGGILFFNLFLERIITFLAWILRNIHLRRIRRRMKAMNMVTNRARVHRKSSLPDILDDDDAANLEQWKPSVYWVMLSLTVASCVVAFCAAAVYAPLEKWSYFEAIYFCFVSFATIGFGDYVSTEEVSYPSVYIYRAVNFMFLVLGCCCIYSLLNVTSIVIKQFLNWVIIKLQCRCFEDPTSRAGRIWRRHSLQYSRRRRRRRSSVVPANVRRSARGPNKIVSVIKGRKDSSVSHGNESDSIGGYDSEDVEKTRKLSGELISMKDFLQANKVSLAVMQKQLYETAQMQRGGGDVYYNQPYAHNGNTRRTLGTEFRPGLVGPLAIVSEKLGDKNSR